MTCANPTCDSAKPIFSRGLCRACYHRQRRNGSLERRYAAGGSTGGCTVEGCDRQAQAKGLCTKHYQQAQHPMLARWKMLRSRYMGDNVSEWDTFEGFLATIGAPPGEKYQLRRRDPRLPWGPENVEWREPVRVKGRLGTSTHDWAAYQRAWAYLRRFGLREEDIDSMRAEQHDKCPICDSALEVTHPDTGKVVRICVDHDHKTGAVRGLLHDHCNKGLGQFNDDPAALRRAADYLDHHTANPRSPAPPAGA